MSRRPATLLALAAGSCLALAALGTGTASAHDPADEQVHLAADLAPLNGSGATGSASATVRGTTLEAIAYTARGLTPDGPHAVHIHYGDDARNECPTARLDADGNGFVSAAEGEPAYGPIVVSLTTVGDTTPGSALHLDRMPVASGGALTYSRTGISFTDVDGTGYGATGTGTAAQIARAVSQGDGVLVVHGVDYDKSGGYSLGARGETELLPVGNGVPAEATDIATCGVLERVEGHK